MIGNMFFKYFKPQHFVGFLSRLKVTRNVNQSQQPITNQAVTPPGPVSWDVITTAARCEQ